MTNLIKKIAIPLLLLTGINASFSVTALANQQLTQQPSLIEQAPQGELSHLAVPTYYQLDLIIDPKKDQFNGLAKIDIQLTTDTKGIWLHGKNLRVNKLTLLTADGKSSTATYSQLLDSGVAYVDFGRKVTAGKIKLSFEYEADFDNNLSGLFKVEEQGDAYVLAKSESIQARKYLPGFDQPGFKSPFLISMTIPKDLKAISNAPEISQTKVDDQLVKIQFAETRPTPTYLLSIAVGPFDVRDDGVIPKNAIRDFDIPLRGFARRGRAKDMNFIMGITPKYVEIFEQQLAQPYPFKKLDIIAAPQWPSGATELSAAITYREQSVLLGDNPAPGAKLGIMDTHAHEIAHMWFGNLVTPPWWDDLWLKEGFATWATPVLLAQFEPNAGHELDAILSNFNTMGADSLATTRAIKEPILKNDNIRNAYDSITYSKSQAIIHMVDSYFGSAKFRKAMGSYVAEFADGVADSKEFYTSIAKQTGEIALTDTFRQFAEQKGVPLMQVKIDCDLKGTNNTSVTFSQSRYQPLGSLIEQNTQWTVPMCVSYPVGSTVKKSCGLINSKNNQLQLETKQCPAWLMPNADGNGYYRWALNPSDWDNLINHYASLNSQEKIAFYDSIFSGFEAGKIKLDKVLAAVKLSTQSDIRQIVETPLGYLGYYLEKILSEQQATQVIAQITPWYLAKLEKINTIEASAIKNKQKLSDNDQLLKNKLMRFLSSRLKEPKTRAQLIAQAEAFIAAGGNTNKQHLSTDLYNTALTVAIEEQGKVFFEKLLKAREVIDDPQFDGASASALGAIQDPALLATIQNYALSEKVGSRESYSMIYSMLSDKTIGETHWSWLKQNLNLILNKIPDQWRRSSPRFASVFCNNKRLAEIDELFEKHGSNAPGYELALAQTRERISLCAALKQSLVP